MQVQREQGAGLFSPGLLQSYTLGIFRSAVFTFICPEAFPPYWCVAVQLRQGRFQEVNLREKTEILLKAGSICSVPRTHPPPAQPLIPGELTHTAGFLKILLPGCSHQHISLHLLSYLKKKSYLLSKLRPVVQ